jgi:toxin ParE1/3/4
MNFKITFSNRAIIDLESIISHYFELDKNTAKRYYGEILLSVKQLQRFPKSGRIIPECEEYFSDKYREIIYENYRIMYKISDSEIIILRILDSRRLLDINFIE